MTSRRKWDCNQTLLHLVPAQKHFALYPVERIRVFPGSIALSTTATMAPRKRKYEETVETPEAISTAEEATPLQKIRGMWEFAALLQYLFFFAKAVKIEEIEVEVWFLVFPVRGGVDENRRWILKQRS